MEIADWKFSLYFKIMGIVWFLFTIIDIFVDKILIQHSADLAVPLQEQLGNFGDIFSITFSVYVIFLLIITIFFIFVLYPDRVFVLHKGFLIFGIGSLATLEKIIYARGRPFLYNKDLKVPICSCDHGMPSGHSALAFCFVYIIDSWVFKQFENFFSRKILKYILRTFFILIGFCVGLSRLLAGVHSYSQIFFGFLTAALFCEIFNFENFKQILLKKIADKRLPIFAFFATFVSALFCQGIYFINKHLRKDHSHWRYWSKCTKCKESFDETDLSQNAVVVLFFVFLLGAHYNYVCFPKKLDHQLEAIDYNKQEITKKNFVRFVLYLIFFVPPSGIIFFIFEKLSQSLEGEYAKALVKFFNFSLLGIYGISCYFLILPFLFRKLGFDLRHDYFSESDFLEKEPINRQRIRVLSQEEDDIEERTKL